jgi:peptide deformylase
VKLPIVQLGDPVLRQVARPLSTAELAGAEIQRLIEVMRETMRDAPGVGLAAPQIGLPLQLAVIEDTPDYLEGVDPEDLELKERSAVPFHVIVNPVIEATDPAPRRFFEGCLSMEGFVGIVARARGVRVRCLDHEGAPRTIDAVGWYARILQHEIDHLGGTVYVDRVETRTLMSADEYARHWGGISVTEVTAALDARRLPPILPKAR